MRGQPRATARGPWVRCREDIVGRTPAAAAGAAEQHGEQIERDHAEHDRIVTNIVKPASSTATLTGSRGGGVRSILIRPTERPATIHSVQHSQHRAERADEPPVEDHHQAVADDDAAVARADSVGGTTPGGKVCCVVCSIERAAPTTSTISSSVSRQPSGGGAERERRHRAARDGTAGPHRHPPVVPVHARCPATRTSAAAGMNWNSPTSPRSSGLRVMSYASASRSRRTVAGPRSPIRVTAVENEGPVAGQRGRRRFAVFI